MSEPEKIASQFNFPGTCIAIKPITEGHINYTYVLTYADGNKNKRYIIQKINTDIFTKPIELMENIDNVTSYISAQLIKEGKDAERGTLHVVHTKNDALYYVDDEGSFWRAYDFIEGSKAYQKADTKLFYMAGVALGRFQKQLAEYPIDTLHDTIPNFHNTPNRIKNFERSVEMDLSGRADSVKSEIAFVLDRKDVCSSITGAISEGRIPLRVTHNDTKLNNVLMDEKTGEVLCLCDLDTVMPGSALYDFGDSIRFGASSADEDEKNLDKVYMDLDLYSAYTDGYLSEVWDKLTKTEVDYLPLSAIIMTLECGMRFLGDHIDGDKYFHIHRENHNLDRARTQLKLVFDMEKKLETMKKLTADIYSKYMK